MIESLLTALPYLIFMMIGYGIKYKFDSPEAIGAIKTLIISILLPATIFQSLLEVSLGWGLFYASFLSLGINLYLLGFGWILSLMLFDKEELSKARSLIMVFPSLGTGLTIYPLVSSFLGKQEIAQVALSDISNKMFIMVGLYGLALYWAKSTNSIPDVPKSLSQKLISVFSEPINLSLLFGIFFGLFNYNLKSLPIFLTSVISKLSSSTTPIMLLFVGMSVKFKKEDIKTVLVILLTKSGLGFLFSCVALLSFNRLFGIESIIIILLPQAGFSVWPLIYASQINTRQILAYRGSILSYTAIFDTEFALRLLTTSIPFSTTIILMILANEKWFEIPTNLLMASLVCFGLLLIIKYCLRMPKSWENMLQYNKLYNKIIKSNEAN